MTARRQVTADRIRCNAAGKCTLNAEAAGWILFVAVKIDWPGQQEAYRFKRCRRLIGRGSIAASHRLVSLYHALEQSFLVAKRCIEARARDAEGGSQVGHRCSFIALAP